MQYEIFGNAMPAVTVTLEQNEGVYTQSGGMTWMTDGVEMSTNMKGGLRKSIGRLFSGESLFMATYTARRPGAQVTFASTFPGEIRPFQLRSGYEIIAQKGAFLCAEQSVTLSAYIPRAGGAIFGGEGIVLQRFSGNGTIFCELDGTVREIDLAPGEIMRVDSGNVAAFEASVDYSVEMVKGFKNMLFGGEGLFLTTLRGPGRIWLQTMTMGELANKLIPYLPTPSND